MFGSPSTPSETPQQQALAADQYEQAAKLDAQQNDQIKRLNSAAQGMRSFAGSAITFPTTGDSSAGGAMTPQSAGGSGAMGRRGVTSPFIPTSLIR
jgi:hypothetical protein